MKIAILETDHYQYGLTQSEIFNEAEKIFFVTAPIGSDMKEYAPRLCNGEFITIESIRKDAEKIIRVCNEQKVDLLLVSPVFDSFSSVLKIAEEVHAKKVITIHNMNFWLKSKVHSLNSWKERRLKQRIVRKFDYIAVEDFIYHHLETAAKKLFDRYRFIYIPFTIFHPVKEKTFHKKDDRLKIVLPGSIHRDRRRYEDVVEVIRKMAEEKAKVTFSFAGRPIEDYGINITKELDKCNAIMPGISSYFPYEGEIKPTRFLEEMETADLVLSTSTRHFKAFGTSEVIGKTKPTAAIHDMMSFQLPGLLPGHLNIPENLKGSVFNYDGVDELYSFIKDMMVHPDKLESFKKKAALNSNHFTAEKIRKKLPF